MARNYQTVTNAPQPYETENQKAFCQKCQLKVWSGVVEVFGQVVPETWASHTERSFAVAAWYSTETTSG